MEYEQTDRVPPMPTFVDIDEQDNESSEDNGDERDSDDFL